MTLDKCGLIKYERKSGQYQPTDLGRVAAYYYVSHATVSVYNDYLKPTLSDIDLLRLFSLSKDFSALAVREEEKQARHLATCHAHDRHAHDRHAHDRHVPR